MPGGHERVCAGGGGRPRDLCHSTIKVEGAKVGRLEFLDMVERARVRGEMQDVESAGARSVSRPLDDVLGFANLMKRRSYVQILERMFMGVVLYFGLVSTDLGIGLDIN